MSKKSENVEPGIPVKTKLTMGFSVSGAPIWLCKELSKEAEKYYANVYYPVIIDWYRKAKAYEDILNNLVSLPPKEDVGEDLRDVETEDDDSVKLFGGEKGEKHGNSS